MLQFVSEYPYLCASLLFLVTLFASLYLLMPREQKASMLIAGLLNFLTGPFCILLEGSYWSPVRLGGMRLGLEDALIGFALGGVVWGMAIWPHRYRLLHSSKGMMRRLIRPVCYLFPFLGLHLLGFSWMAAYLATLLLVVLVELFLKPALWPVALSGALLFPPLYIIYFALVFALWPQFLLQWNPALPWGWTVLGLPLGELVWSILFGSALPLIVASVLKSSWIRDL